MKVALTWWDGSSRHVVPNAHFANQWRLDRWGSFGCSPVADVVVTAVVALTDRPGAKDTMERMRPVGLPATMADRVAMAVTGATVLAERMEDVADAWWCKSTIAIRIC